MNVRMPLEQLRRLHPMPWTTQVMQPNGIPGGRVFVVDASGKEVPLFVITGFVTEVTERVVAQQPAQQPQSQPQEQTAS